MKPSERAINASFRTHILAGLLTFFRYLCFLRLDLNRFVRAPLWELSGFAAHSVLVSIETMWVRRQHREPPVRDFATVQVWRWC